MSTDNNQQQTQLHHMAIALITDGLGQLTEETEATFARFEEDGRPWREHVIFKLNGYDLPVEMIKAAIHKRWLDYPSQDVAAFTRLVLKEWKLL
jgi:hypothetical protein